MLQDADGNTKASAQVDALQTTCQDRLEVRAAKLWWPIGSRPQPGYRHTVKVSKIFNLLDLKLHSKFFYFITKLH